MCDTPNLYGTHCSSHSTIGKAHKTLCHVYQNKSLYITDMYTCSKFKLENKRKKTIAKQQSQKETLKNITRTQRNSGNIER